MRKIKVIIVFITLVLLLSVRSFALPSISSVNGTIENGQTITITGSGFGSSTGAVPNQYDFFDDASIDTDDWDVSYMTPTTNGQRHARSTRCISGDFNDNWKVAVDSRVDSNVGYGDKLYVSWWQKCGDSWDWNDAAWNNYKIIRNSERPSSADEGCEFLLNELGGMKIYNNSGDAGTLVGLGVSLEDIQIVDSWVHHEMVIKCPSTNNASTDQEVYWAYDGTVVTCLDGTEGLTWWSKDDSSHGDNVANNMANIVPKVIGGHYSTGTPVNNSNVYVDDFYVTSSWKRVTIGSNTSGYGNEVQTVTSWSDTEIQITVYSGAFNDLSGEEICVFDADNNVATYTIGSTSTSVKLSNITATNITFS